MRGNRPNEKAIMTEIADRELSRKLQFSQLGLQKGRDDLMHKGRSESLSASKKALKDKKKTLNMQLAVGAGTGILSHLEGKRRAKKIQDRTDRADTRYNNMMKEIRQAPQKYQQQIGIWPGSYGPTPSGQK